MKPNPKCIYKVKKHEYITQSNFGNLYISFESPIANLVYYSTNEWLTQTHGKKSFSEIPLLDTGQRKQIYKMKAVMDEYLNSMPNLCRNCIHKNNYLLTNKCNQTYKTI